jgi:hypothetical protein
MALQMNHGLTMDTATHHLHICTDVEEDESASKDGSNLCARDNCLPSQDTDLDNKSNYNPEYMEEDWNYNNFLEGIQFKYNILANNTQLSMPLNIYNVRGLCQDMQ